MKQTTQRLWERQDRHTGDRARLFEAVREFLGDGAVLYPGSWVDVAASFAFDEVTYVDIDRQAVRFFADTDGVDELIRRHRQHPTRANWRFIHADYRQQVDVADQSVDLLVSLYAGFISEHCTGYLRPGGWLLVNPSHGDVAMASLNPEYALGAVITLQSGKYGISETELDSYLIPKRQGAVTKEDLHRDGRGVAYTRSPFAYLFQRHT